MAQPLNIFTTDQQRGKRGSYAPTLQPNERPMQSQPVSNGDANFDDGGRVSNGSTGEYIVQPNSIEVVVSDPTIFNAFYMSPPEILQTGIREFSFNKLQSDRFQVLIMKGVAGESVEDLILRTSQNNTPKSDLLTIAMEATDAQAALAPFSPVTVFESNIPPVGVVSDNILVTVDFDNLIISMNYGGSTLSASFSDNGEIAPMYLALLHRDTTSGGTADDSGAVFEINTNINPATRWGQS